MSPINNVTILENFEVAPSLGAVSELSVPLTCCDMRWIGFPPLNSITFYQHPVSRACFLDTIVPGLKNALSTALKHFPLISGNLIIPSDSTDPFIKYAEGNSVSFAIVESNIHNFEYLVGNQPRICSEFHQLIPQMQKSTESGGSRIDPLVSLQVTLFPGEGFCIGITVRHVLADGNSVYSFLKTWADVSKFGEDEATKSDEFPPIFDRKALKVHTQEIDSVYWSTMRDGQIKNDVTITGNPEFYPEDNEKVRTTFIISLEDIQKLKNHVFDRKTSINHLSTFTVVSSYVWTCLIKSRIATKTTDKVDDDDDDEEEDESEKFIFAVDLRGGRTDPPIPSNYFGNGIVGCLVSAKTVELCGDEGFFIAIEKIGDIIQQLSVENGVDRALESRFKKKTEIKDLNKLYSIAGSTRQSHYNLDFGWGKPKKFEMTSIDWTGSMSLSGCTDNSGSLEIGLALHNKRMDVFTQIFTKGLLSL